MMNQLPHTSRSSFKTTSSTHTLERRIPPEMNSYTSTSPVIMPCFVPSAMHWSSPLPPPKRLRQKLMSVPLQLMRMVQFILSALIRWTVLPSLMQIFQVRYTDFYLFRRIRTLSEQRTNCLLSLII